MIQVRADIAASFQRVAIAHLTERCERGLTWALNEAPETKHLVVSGGVAANQCLRSSLERSTTKAGLELVCPPPSLCTDNGIMIAWAGIERYAPRCAECLQHAITFRPSRSDMRSRPSQFNMSIDTSQKFSQILHHAENVKSPESVSTHTSLWSCAMKKPLHTCVFGYNLWKKFEPIKPCGCAKNCCSFG